MPSSNNNTKAFLALVRAGLWEKEDCFFPYGKVDYEVVMRFAEEQSVIGLVTAGMEHVQDVKVSQVDLLQFIGKSLQLEKRNHAMNKFIAEIVEKMRNADIYTLLVKGQGIAQCYERPMWRASGDVDFLLSKDNYYKAKDFLLPLSSDNKIEGRYSQHLGMNIGEWYVEIHGTLRSGLSTQLDKEIDAVQRDVFYGGNVRSWQSGKTTVFLPSPNNDVFFVLTHFIKHFYKEGMTLRQVCDWCRLLWIYREKVDLRLLESRIRRAGLMPEWRAFAALAVDYLGMPIEAMPLYHEGKKWHGKGRKILNLILKGYSGKRIPDTIAIAKIFPYKTLCYIPSIFLNVNWLKLKERVFGDGDR